MATIIQKPDTLSLSRNLKELIISTSSEISLQLLKGDSMLLEETYLPDVNNRVHVDLADIVTSTLSLTMPSGDAVSTSQSSVYSDFTVKVDGTSVAEFTAVRSGVERFSDTAANFLTANWLTWQPQVKEVLHDQPEWLTYYPASGSCACYARFYYTDGTSGEKKVCDVSQCVSINTRFSKLWALDESGKERYGVIDVYIKDAQGLRLTYVQRYVLCSQGALDEVYLCENSLGGLDTFRFYGDRKLVPEIGYTSLLLDNSYTAADPDLSRKWSQNTGMLTGRECEWCWELFRSSAAYHLYRGTILPIVLDASSVEKSAMSVLAAYSFDYRYASDLGLLNVVRSENLPEVVEVSGPDAEVFFLTPRLNEFPSAVLSDDLIIPVQSPYEESWYTLSVGGLKSALLSSVETIYGPMWHVHDNLQVLNLLSVDEKGNLLYNGLAVGSGIVGAHDHHGETIRPEKIIVGDVEITCVDGRLHISKGLVSDGDIAAFGAEEGEEGGSGGLDIARLWEELEADDSSKVIDVSHIPGSVVLQDELVEILDDYPLTTEMNEALSGKADKDWVEKELAKYLLLTGGKISGDLEVTGTLKIGDAVLSYAGGRLHVSSSVTSDGDFVAFGDEEGSTGSGGLDVARMWEELEADDSSKVIDVSHIPGSVVLQDELVEILDDYPLTTEMNEALSGKADKDTTLAGYGITDAYTKTEIDGELAKYVTIAGNQDITGVKTFVNGIKIGGITLSAIDGQLHVSSTVTSDGDFVAFGDEEEGTAGGGLDVERLWQELGDSGSEQIAKGHLTDALSGYATQDYVNNRINDLINGAPAAYDTLKEIADVLEGNVDSIGDILTALGGKADKATTLAGYGIKDAYTKTQIDEELAKYVTIAGNQDITGVKTFVNGIKIGSISLSVVDGRLHVSSTVTSDGDFVAFGDEDGASGSGGLDIARLWQELEADDSSKVIDASHIPSITKAKISDFPTKWAWADISGKPSTFAPSAHSHAISDVTGLQGALDSKWVWNESQVKAVKVNSAASADNADTLDGVHANGLLTALTSSATTNLSLTVGGKSLSVAGFYAKFADQLRTARKINGTSFNGAHEITTEKWGMARLVSIKDYTQDNAGATKSVDGQESFSLLLPQSIKVKTLDVDGVTLSVIDGRLHISATATSAGDFVAYGNDEGGAGVLDVDKLWQELGGSESSKVIDLSHIPSIPTSKITGLSDYVWNILVTPGTLSGPKIDASHLPPLSDLSGNLDSSRITGLDNALSGYVSSVTTSGEGNAVTGYAKSGNTLTLKKDLTFLTSVPKATSSAYGGIKIGYPESGKNYPVELDSSGRAYVSVPWTDTNTNTTYTLTKSGSTITLTGSDGSKTSVTDSNTTYSLSSFGITATAKEINKLDGVGTLLHSGNYTSYTYPTTVAKISDLHSSWDSILTTSGVRRRSMTFNGTNYPCYTAAANTSDITWYAPTTAGASGQWLKSTGGTPVWANDGSGSGLDADLLDGYQASSFLLKSGGTMTGNLTLKSMGGMWLSGKTQAPIMTNGASSTNGTTYHPVIWGKTDAGDVWNLGHGASDQVGFFGFYSERTVNGTDWAHYIKVSDGTVHFNKTVYGTTFSGAFSGNATSATKLQTSRTLWGRPFDGTGNVSGDMTGVEHIWADYFHLINSSSNPYLRFIVGGVNTYVQMTSAGISMDYGRESGKIIYLASSGYVGIGTTSPAYKLDVAGRIRATSGITIGSTDDYGWYISTGTRISAGVDVARGVNVGSLLVSNAWADYTKVPTNGIYSKGDIWTGGRLFIPSSEGNNVFDAYIA